MNNNTAKLAAALALIIAATGANAGSLVDIDVLNRDAGQLLPEYRHRGQQYVPGFAGEEFSVVLRNRSAERVMAVLSGRWRQCDQRSDCRYHSGRFMSLSPMPR